ncbi:MAG TPA: DUF1015 domain-containing protein, partial [Balneola sp.]|nr:DUF1015 domain-containing protein [Balneola sp.]
MAIVKPFKAWRPEIDVAENVISVPYDVINTKEAREMAVGKPNSFLHVIRPEIDFPPSVDIHSEDVYARGKKNLEALLNSGFFMQESR